MIPACWEENIAFEELTEIPHVMIAIFIEKPTPFIEEFFQKIENLDYDKDKITMFIHNNIEYHEEDIENFLDEHKVKYKSVDYITVKDSVKEWHARNKGMCNSFFALIIFVKFTYVFSSCEYQQNQSLFYTFSHFQSHF